MTVLSKEVNINFTDRIALLVALHWVKNFKLCNKHQSFFTKYLGLVTKKVSKEDLALQIDVIWQNHNLLDFTLLHREIIFGGSGCLGWI